MITVEEASKIIETHSAEFGTESIPLNQAIGRILREEITADRDFPPYHRVTMDGIAIQFDAFAKGSRTFKVAGIAPAGAEQQELSDPTGCLEVMTGAILPKGTDTVIRYEDVDINDGVAQLTINDIISEQNVHFKGQDRKQGEVVIKPGITLSSAEIGVCATVGKHEVEVSKLPKTIILSSGDELVEIDQAPLPHQIRKSNVYRLATLLKSLNIKVSTAHVMDDYEEIVRKLNDYLEQYDLIILSGGVSKGKFDFLPQALEEAGVKKLFHKIKQRPGKPFWFGKYQQGTTVFAFPGNPVSSFMCAQQYFKPWLEKSLKAQPVKKPLAILTEDVSFKPDLTYFLEVKLDFNEEGKILAQPVKGNGSGDLANLVDADAFLELPRGRDQFHKDETFPFISYRNLF